MSDELRKDCAHMGGFHVGSPVIGLAIHKCGLHGHCSNVRTSLPVYGKPPQHCGSCNDYQQAEKPEESSSTPNAFIRGWNFTKAMVRWASAGAPMRTEDEIAERLAICQQCPHLVSGVCQKCGCQCVETERVLNKLALATEKCPIGKWS